MPVAQKHLSSIIEDSHLTDSELGDNGPTIPRIDLAIFQEIQDKRDKIKKFQDEEKEDKRKIDKWSAGIKEAQELLSKAEEKYQQVLTRKEALEQILDQKKEKIREATDYWKNYGLEVRQLSTDNSFNHYEFIYTNSSKRREIGIRFQDGKLEVVSQSPEIFNTEALEKLNTILTERCVGREGVDYKLAMITIKKEIFKNPLIP